MYGDLMREMQGVWGRWPGVNFFEELDHMMPNFFSFPFSGRALESMHYSLHTQPRIGALPPYFLNQMMDYDYPAGYNCHSFMHQSVVSMTSDSNGRPQVYEETMSTTTAPGGIKETKQTVRDSRTGTQRMAIGRYIGDRSHTIEKEQNVESGEQEERHEYENIEEEEGHQFDREFVARTQLRSIMPTDEPPLQDIPAIETDPREVLVKSVSLPKVLHLQTSTSTTVQLEASEDPPFSDCYEELPPTSVEETPGPSTKPSSPESKRRAPLAVQESLGSTESSVEETSGPSTKPSSPESKRRAPLAVQESLGSTESSVEETSGPSTKPSSPESKRRAPLAVQESLGSTESSVEETPGPSTKPSSPESKRRAPLAVQESLESIESSVEETPGPSTNPPSPESVVSALTWLRSIEDMPISPTSVEKSPSAPVQEKLSPRSINLATVKRVGSAVSSAARAIFSRSPKEKETTDTLHDEKAASTAASKDVVEETHFKSRWSSKRSSKKAKKDKSGHKKS